MPDLDRQVVNFEFAGGWSAVQAHFDSELSKQGYQRIPSGAMPRLIMDTTAPDSTIIYDKSGALFVITVFSFSEAMDKGTRGVDNSFRDKYVVSFRVK